MYTNNIQRIHINEDRIQTIDNYTVPTKGFVGIGDNSGWGGTPGHWDATGPYSRLHLNGQTGVNPGVSQFGYRPWMRTGVTFTDGADMNYIGIRSIDVNANINEMVINVSNDASTSFGPDDIVFRLTGAGSGNMNIDSDFGIDTDLDGRHLARFTGTGEMGLGPTFGIVNSHPDYVRPVSMLHVSRDASKDTWLQVTNQNGTEQTMTDGLRMGITGTGTAHIKQQENLPLIFYTNGTEDARIEPAAASTMGANTGMMGIGNFSPTGPNTALADVVDAKLDIDGDLRIRTVTEGSNLTQVLVIDPVDKNRVHWRDISGLGNNTDNQMLNYVPGTGQLSISGGNTVTISLPGSGGTTAKMGLV